MATTSLPAPNSPKTLGLSQLQEQLLTQYADITKDVCKDLGIELRELVARPRSTQSRVKDIPTEMTETRRTAKLIKVAQQAVLRHPGLADVAQVLAVVSIPPDCTTPWPLSTDPNSRSFHVYRTPLDKFRVSLDKEKVKFEKESQVYRAFQENLEKERKALQDKLEAKEARAKRSAAEQKRLMEEMQTKRSLRNLKRMEIKEKHEVMMKLHFEDMRRKERRIMERLSPSSNEHKAATASNSPKRVKTEEDASNTDELLRNIQAKLRNSSLRSVELKASYKQRIQKHLEKVNQTLSTTLAAEETLRKTQLFKAAQKSSKVSKHRSCKESFIQLMTEKARSSYDEKLAKALGNRSELAKQEQKKLHLVEKHSNAKLHAATISLDSIQKETLRRKVERSQVRKQEQLENYSKQVQMLEMKKNRVRDKERHSSAIVSLMNRQKLELVETKIRDQFELKRQREESKDKHLKPGKT